MNVRSAFVVPPKIYKYGNNFMCGTFSAGALVPSQECLPKEAWNCAPFPLASKSVSQREGGLKVGST